jgi:hypothetical protein
MTQTVVSVAFAAMLVVSNVEAAKRDGLPGRRLGGGTRALETSQVTPLHAQGGTWSVQQ